MRLRLREILAPSGSTRGALVLAGLLALGLGWVLWPSGGPGLLRGSGSTPEAPAATRDEVESLRRALADQAATLRTLTEELALLREETAALGGGLAWIGDESTRTGASSATSAASDSPSEGSRARDPSARGAAPGERPSFDAEGLLAAGFSSREVDRLRERWERLELDRLELNDRALREEWLFTPRHQDEHRALEATLRQELDEEGFDAYLYATGQPNRVFVKEVLGNSSASRAGVLPGDVIVSYDGERTFIPRDLQLATAQGQRGELVRIEVVRDGRPVTLQVQRGPLGIILRGAAEPPRSAG